MARPKKRGVKPGTKRGPYRKAKRTKPMTLKDYSKKVLAPMAANYAAKPIQKMGFMELAYDAPNSVGNNLPSLISELASTIDTLEAQLTAQIDRIKSILV